MKPLLFALLAIPCLALADYQPTEYQFRGWTATTSENLYIGRTHTSYPLTNLFDGSPRTAWVFSGPVKETKDNSTANLWSGHYGLGFQPQRGQTIDGIDLMNGYAKTTKTFAENRRVVEVAVYGEAQPYDDLKPIKVVRLADRQGWHHISLPRGKYDRGIALVFRQFAGPKDADIALSELRFTNLARLLPISSGSAFTVTEGSDCGCGTTYELRQAGGGVLAKCDSGEGAWPEWDKARRYVAGLQMVGSDYRKAILWVADTKNGKLVYRRKLPASAQGYSLFREGDPMKGPLVVACGGRSLPVPYIR